MKNIIKKFIGYLIGKLCFFKKEVNNVNDFKEYINTKFDWLNVIYDDYETTDNVYKFNTDDIVVIKGIEKVKLELLDDFIENGWFIIEEVNLLLRLQTEYDIIVKIKR